MKRLAVGLVIVLLVAGAGLAVYVYSSSRATAASGEQPIAGTGPARMLLNEILFQPSDGQSPFVELVNAGAEPAKLDGFALVNQAAQKYQLAAGLIVPAGSVLLIRFGGTAAPDGAVQQGLPGFLDAVTGSLVLQSGDATLDEAWWSTAGGPSFSLGRGGRIPTLVVGTTLGRPRGAIGHGPSAWTVFNPADVTPGMPNSLPAVTGLMPLSGAILRASTPTLSWYGVPTATRYRIQVATDRKFASPVFDGTTAASGSGIVTEKITTPTLSPGRYFWRVQAIFGDADRASAAFSTPAILWLDAPERAARASGWDNLMQWLVSPALAAQGPPAVTRKVLPVPLILQNKDTSLLSMEGDEAGAKPWDAPWPEARRIPYCARGSIAMINSYYHGNVSQDRISYEGDKNWIEGPRRDLNVLGGWEDGPITRGLKFAVGGDPRLDFSETQQRAYVRERRDMATMYWSQHTAEIDAKRPILATNTTHAYVIVGYGEDARGKYFVINDPAFGQYDWLFFPAEGVVDDEGGTYGSGYISTSFFMPDNARGKLEDPAVSKDSDGDGVMDFDETERFGTNPNEKDSDGDGVPDKQEIRAWVFDAKFGYSPDHLWGDNADQDHDHKRMEVDADSDGGGCLDGMEDTNSNGKHEAARQESYNFDDKDDDCLSGTYRFVQDTLRNDGYRQKLDFLHEVQFSLREIEGTQRGRATVTASYRQEITEHVPTECPHRIDSTEPFQYVVEVQAITAPMPDGTVSVTLRTPAGWQPPPLRHVSTCSGYPPFEQPGPEIGVAGILRDGVLDQHVDIPIDMEGETGKKFYETHIRMRSGRR